MMKYQNAKQSAAIPPTPPITPPTVAPVFGDADAGAAPDILVAMADPPLDEREEEDKVWPVGIGD